MEPEVNGNTAVLPRTNGKTDVKRIYYVIQRRGKEEKYLSGRRILHAGKTSARGSNMVPNWTSSKSNAQRFLTTETAKFEVDELFGPSGFGYLRLVTIKERA